jgi:hypothetical protein
MQEPEGPIIKDSGNRRVFNTGGQRDITLGKGRMDLLPCRALIAVARHFEAGARKYEDRNWEKGIPLHSFFDSGLRHALQFLMGKRDEPHLEAACWNFLCALDTLKRIEEGLLPESLFDIPAPLQNLEAGCLGLEAKNPETWMPIYDSKIPEPLDSNTLYTMYLNQLAKERAVNV